MIPTTVLIIVPNTISVPNHLRSTPERYGKRRRLKYESTSPPPRNNPAVINALSCGSLCFFLSLAASYQMMIIQFLFHPRKNPDPLSRQTRGFSLRACETLSANVPRESSPVVTL